MMAATFTSVLHMRLTHEQELIVDSNAVNLKVNAFAGSAKTTTLDKFARARPGKDMLYLAFSKAVQLHAATIFPKHVKCKTPHGLAFPQFGVPFADAGKLVPGLRVGEIVNHIELANIPPEMHFYAADLCIKTISRFVASEELGITETTVSDLIMPNNHVSAEYIARMSGLIWTKMQDVNDSSIGMTHDGYLKLFFNSNPTLNFDHILFDEAQDANPIMSRIVNEQAHCTRIIVGDEHQSIFGFRHAVNAMADFQADETCFLTKSFRFGSEIANLGNLLLSRYKKESREMIGNDSVRSRIGFISPNAPFAVVARSNATLFAEAAAALSLNKKIHHVGGVDGYRLSDMMDAYHLMCGHHKEIRNPQIRAFKDFDSFDEYAEVSGDKEFRGVAGVARRHGSTLPNLVRSVRAASQKDPLQAQVQLATTHKAKGLEWDNVKLADDFINLFEKDDKPATIKNERIEDINIIYVALSRAKYVLQPSADLAKLMKLAKPQGTGDNLPSWAKAIN
jgi:F-box protein 18 (helicase)